MNVLFHKILREEEKRHIEEKNRYEGDLKRLKDLVKDLNEEICEDVMNEFVVVSDDSTRKCNVLFTGKQDENYLYGLRNCFYMVIAYESPSRCIERLIHLYLNDLRDNVIEYSKYNLDRKMSRDEFINKYHEEFVELGQEY